ncbi:hypothetical protein OEB96_01310 [Paraliomyxa miuraensis]|nr:hypothetical protein [Paraliomyxa miuraensis]
MPSAKGSGAERRRSEANPPTRAMTGEQSTFAGDRARSSQWVVRSALHQPHEAFPLRRFADRSHASKTLLEPVNEYLRRSELGPHGRSSHAHARFAGERSPLR